MDYITVRIAAATSELDDLCARLMDFDVGGVEIEDKKDFTDFLANNKEYWDYVDEKLEQAFDNGSCVKVYVEDNDSGRELLSRIENAVGKDRVSTSLAPEKEWANNWKKYFKPIALDKILILPAWEKAESTNEKIVMRVDPGMSFGSGQHETTKMCLTALEKTVEHGMSVLDLGCGSGILSIAALLLGAAYAMGIDIDADAARVAKENAAANGVEQNYVTLAGNILSDMRLREKAGERKYEIVVANIVADVIIPLSAFAAQYMAEGGIFICSGIINLRVDEVERALIENGFKIKEKKQDGEWYAFVTER